MAAFKIMRNSIFGIALVVVLLFIGAITVGIWLSFNDTVVSATVTDKIVKQYKDDSKYLIFTDKGVFENTDSLLRWKWDSSDFYGKIMKDHKYNFTIIGLRVPIFSIYPNLIKIEEVR